MEQIADWLAKLGVAQCVQSFAMTKSIFRSSPSDRYAPKGPRRLPRSSSEAVASDLQLWRSLGCRNGPRGAHTDQTNSARRRRATPAHCPVHRPRRNPLHQKTGNSPWRATSAAPSATTSPRSTGCRQHAKSGELRTEASYGRVIRDQGRIREAYDLLAPVYGCFEGVSINGLKEARPPLDEFGL